MVRISNGMLMFIQLMVRTSNGMFVFFQLMVRTSNGMLVFFLFIGLCWFMFIALLARVKVNAHHLNRTVLLTVHVMLQMFGLLNGVAL
jgi:hypothetical protein